jgi:hypothetical protein
MKVEAVPGGTAVAVMYSCRFLTSAPAGKAHPAAAQKRREKGHSNMI